MRDENLPRNKWKLGKVLTIIRGKVGVERGVVDRPVQQIYPSELRAEAIESENEKKLKPDDAAVIARLRRRVALNARSVIKAVQLSEEENQI